MVVLIINHLVRTYLDKHLKNAGLRAVSLITNLLRVLVVVVAVFFLGENVFHVQMSGMVQALGATAFGTTASVRIFIADIEYATSAMDAVMCAIAERGYLSDTIRQVDPRWK